MHQTATVDTRKATRLVGLDLMRLAAVVLVLGRHIPLPAENVRIPWRGFFEAWFRGGWVGVDLFFVLSGFLVSGLLFDEYLATGLIKPWRFYVRRGWKIYPAFYVMIATTLVYYTYLGVHLPKLSVWSELLFLQSYLPGLWNHTWSLAVEEHFYLLLPFVLVLLLRIGKPTAPLRAVVPLAVLVGAVCLGLRIARWQAYPTYDHQTNLFPTHLRLDGLFCGVALAYLHRFHSLRFTAIARPWRFVLIGIGAALLAPAFCLPLSNPLVFTVGLTVMYLAAGLLLVGVLMCEPPRDGVLGRALRALALLGSYSYSIYLWHMPVLVWGVPLVQQTLGRRLGFAGAVAVYLLGSFVWGIIMAKCVELPTLKLRDRWFPARTRTLPVH